MTERIINQLHFRSNSKTILSFLKTGKTKNEATDLFTLSSIEPIPEYQCGKLTEELKKISLMNVQPLKLSGTAMKIAKEGIYGNLDGQQPRELIERKLMESREKIVFGLQSGSPEMENDLIALDRAVKCLRNYGFVSLYDWKLTQWGTPADVVSVTESTFVEGTSYLEFETAWTPPVPAIKSLSNIFPSVRFELLYKHASEEAFHKVEIFPRNPFGY